MKILLLKDVKELGKKNEVVTVKDGYGKNYLINKGLGILATDTVIEQNKKKLEKEKIELEKEKELLIGIKDDIEMNTLKFASSVTPKGSLFKTITSKDVFENLMNLYPKLNISKKDIYLEKIKTTGTFEAQIKLGLSIEATQIIEVIEE